MSCCVFNDNTEWMLEHSVFISITRYFGVSDIDLFASCLNSQLGAYVSWQADPHAKLIDANFRSTGINLITLCVSPIYCVCVSPIHDLDTRDIYTTPVTNPTMVDSSATNVSSHPVSFTTENGPSSTSEQPQLSSSSE